MVHGWLAGAAAVTAMSDDSMGLSSDDEDEKAARAAMLAVGAAAAEEQSRPSPGAATAVIGSSEADELSSDDEDEKAARAAMLAAGAAAAEEQSTNILATRAVTERVERGATRRPASSSDAGAGWANTVAHKRAAGQQQHRPQPANELPRRGVGWAEVAARKQAEAERARQQQQPAKKYSPAQMGLELRPSWCWRIGQALVVAFVVAVVAVAIAGES